MSSNLGIEIIEKHKILQKELTNVQKATNVCWGLKHMFWDYYFNYKKYMELENAKKYLLAHNLFYEKWKNLQ